ncbi:DUF3987 domain-containing protein [Methylobacterium sp. E-041]|uniref:DUF3987 domain-containing protein n=1 Tax=unclassified Methylobacterium TaxID=2615210 RepID=UPI001FB8F6D0|nr:MULTISPECIES: DUF3987 domain-containing protein [unclassified Methylobacterium]MCJ2037612.1 DUF3987 domain-containing protein [Methylobacterium sp. J-059]MCJ2105362.1 DUF3987 domain-containing protein [Methylobacterium sp. E-041]
MKFAPSANELECLGPAAADDWHDRHHAPIGARSTAGTEGHGSWGEPDLSLLGTGRRPAPAFPLYLLGPWADWCERKARSASAPVDYVSVALLASVGATIANVRWPQAGTAWTEQPVLWCSLVGPPSSSKSPSMDAAFSLVRFAEDRMAYGFELVQQEHATMKQACDARVEAWKIEVKTAVKNGDPDVPPMPDNAHEPPAPVCARIRVADATVEALGALAAGLPRGLLLVRDELAGWLGAFDKYGGGGSDRAFAIEMYGGRSYVVDRMKNPEPLHIRHLSIGVLGGVQPDKLEMILNGPDDGLASRLLWAWADTKPKFTLARGVEDGRPARSRPRCSTTSPRRSSAGRDPEHRRMETVRSGPRSERARRTGAVPTRNRASNHRPRGRAAVAALRAAETDVDALPTALAEIGRLDALDRRRALASYAIITKPDV